VIVGHSWGTLVALEMALRDPDRTAGLVLLSGYYFPTLRLDVPLLFWPAVPVVGDVLRYAVSPWLGRLSKPLVYKWLFAPAPVTPSFAERVPSELIFRPWQIRATAAEVALLIPGAAALAGRYRELRMPTAIVAGPGDRVIDFESHSARLYQALPRSTLRSLPRAGHMIHHSAPQQIAAVIRDMVRATQSTEAASGG
jgi:pimeloyl-ACP methyl ester carboxylesterase